MHSRFLLFLIVQVLLSEISSGQNTGLVLNKGVPGNNSSDLLRRMNSDVIANHPDLVIIMIGTNDLLNTKKMICVDDFSHNLERLTDSLSLHGAEVVLISPPPIDTVYLFERHDRSKYDQIPVQKLENGRNAMKTLCEKKGLLFIDLFSHLQELQIPKHETDNIIRNRKNSGANDGIHFTVAGNELLAQFIFSKLLTKYGSLGNLKIICLGDSITYGVYMKGAGTSKDDTYPAVLEKLIINSMQNKK